MWNQLPDYHKHFVVGLVGGLIWVNIHPTGGFIFMVILLAGKEIIWDKMMKQGTPDWMDFWYGFVPLLIIYILKLLWIWYKTK